jgi:hypothetical protein
VGIILNPPPVKLISGLISNSSDLLEKTKELLQAEYGFLELTSHVFPFDFTRYYEREMGPGLIRQYICFAPLILRERLPEIKIYTNNLERSFTGPGGGRQINIDPGYLTAENMILATTKKASHRPYLQDGIYAEVTYRFIKGSFQELEWTYPDYRQPQSIEFFSRVRDRYRHQLAEISSEE